MKEFLDKNHSKEFEIEKLTEKMMQLQIQPHLYKVLNDLVKDDKQFFASVSIEVRD